MANEDPTAMVLAYAFAAAVGLAAFAVLLRFKSNRVEVNPDPGVGTGMYRVWDICGVLLLFFLFGGLVILGMLGGGDTRRLTSDVLMNGIMVQVLLTWIVISIVVFRARFAEWLGIRWAGWKRLLWLGPACVAIMWGVFGVMHFAGYMKWIESMGVEPVQDSVRVLQESQDVALVFWMVVAALVVAPVCEEIVFRGYCYPVLKKYAGARVSLVSTSLVFACAHGNLASLLPLFLLGGLLVLVYERTQSIWAPIGVHFCFNAATVAVQMLARWLEIPMAGEL